MGRKSESARVVGFDFGPPAPAGQDAPPPAPPAGAVATDPGYAPPPSFAEQAGYVPPGYGAPGAYPPPPPAWTPPAAKRGLTGKAAVAAVLGAVLIAGVMVKGMWDENAPPPAGAKRVERVTLKRPPAVGSMRLMSNSAAKKAERDVRTGMPSSAQPVVGLYGRGGTPRYMLVAAFSAEPTSRASFDGFAKGWRENGGKVGRARTMPGNLTCGTTSIEGMRGSVCAWAGGRSNGFVVAYSGTDLRKLASVTAKARNHVDGR